MRGSVHRIKEWIKSQKGFTLIELMAVLAILALILLIAVPGGGAMIEKAKKSADESSIALMEDAGEKAHADKLPFDAVDAELPEEESYKIPTLVEEGYLKLEPDSKFYSPENYVKKKNKGGEFIYKGIGAPGSESDEETAPEPEVGGVVKPLACDKAVTDQGYICIYTPEELNNVRNDLSAKYILMNDIDLASYPAWTPMGTASSGFRGELNGNGYKILNLTMDQVASKAAGYSPTHYGLFGGMNYGTIQNLTIEGYKQTLSGTANAGALVGFLNNGYGMNPSGIPVTIKNVRVTGDVSHTGSGTTGGGMIGSLVGAVTITNTDLLIDSIYYNGSILSTSPTSSNLTNAVTGLLGKVNVENTTKPVDVTITNITLDDVDLNGVYAVAGLSSEIALSYSQANLTISGIDITGKMESGTKIAGLATKLSISGSDTDESRGNHHISDYKMGASLHLRGAGTSSPGSYKQELTAAGLVYETNVLLADGTTTIEDVAVTGAITAANPGNRLIEMAGLLGYYYNTDNISSTTKPDPVDNLTIRNVAISSPISGAGGAVVSGVIGRYKPYASVYADAAPAPKVTHVFSDIAVTGDMSGSRVSGLSDEFIAYGLTLDIDMSNILVSGAMTGANVSGLIYNYYSGNMILNHLAKNITIDSDITASANANGLISKFMPFTNTGQTGKLTIGFSGIKINGDITGVTTAGISNDFNPRNGLMEMSFTDMSVNGVLTGTNVAGFANLLQPNLASPQKAPVTFLLDGFAFKGSMVAGTNAAGMFGTFNHNNTETSYTGLRDGMDYTFQNVNLDGTVTVSNGATGSYGYLIGKHFAEKRNNTYLFKNVTLSNEATILGEAAGFKKGRIADPAATGTADLIFENVN